MQPDGQVIFRNKYNSNIINVVISTIQHFKLGEI